MSLKLEHLIKPFTSMDEDEQLALINKIRHNRTIVRDSKPKRKAAKTERKKSAKTASAKKKKLLEYLSMLSPEEREKFLAGSLTDD